MQRSTCDSLCRRSSRSPKMLSILLVIGASVSEPPLVDSTDALSCTIYIYIYIPYSGYFSRGNIFLKVVILAISWKKFRGFGRAHAVCAFSCSNISWFASRPRKPRKYYPSKNTRYTVYIRPAPATAHARRYAQT